MSCERRMSVWWMESSDDPSCRAILVRNHTRDFKADSRALHSVQLPLHNSLVVALNQAPELNYANGDLLSIRKIYIFFSKGLMLIAELLLSILVSQEEFCRLVYLPKSPRSIYLTRPQSWHCFEGICLRKA